jgi:hypothetical protein
MMQVVAESLATRAEDKKSLRRRFRALVTMRAGYADEKDILAGPE